MISNTVAGWIIFRHIEKLIPYGEMDELWFLKVNNPTSEF